MIRLALALTIWFHPGGGVMQHAAHVDALRAEGVPARIMGTCLSACAMYLSLPGSCAHPYAVIGLHRLRMDPRFDRRPVEELYALRLPPALRSVWEQAKLRPQFTYVLGRETGLPPC